MTIHYEEMIRINQNIFKCSEHLLERWNMPLNFWTLSFMLDIVLLCWEACLHDHTFVHEHHFANVWHKFWTNIWSCTLGFSHSLLEIRGHLCELAIWYLQDLQITTIHDIFTLIYAPYKACASYFEHSHLHQWDLHCCLHLLRMIFGISSLGHAIYDQILFFFCMVWL